MNYERPQNVGKYEITGELGRGGMGVVYRGRDPVIKREVALKVIRRRDLDPSDAESVLERFKREARAAGSLHHPNIVAIYEYGEDQDAAFIAMECVPGRSLRDHLRPCRQLSTPSRDEVSLNACRIEPPKRHSTMCFDWKPT